MPAQKTVRPKSTPAVSAIFSCLYHATEPITKQEVAKQTKLSLPTIYQGFSTLEDMGLIEAGEDRSSTGGRRAQTFAVARKGIAAIGVSITGHSVRTVACNLFGERLTGLYLKRALPKVRTAAALGKAIAAATDEMVALLAEREIRAVGVGVAVPSALDPASGRLLNTSVLRLKETSVTADELTRELALPAGVFNDANCGGFSQCFPQIEDASFAYLSLERGVGGAIIIDGRPFEGPHGTSGEFGHICIEPGGKTCTCGKAGCLEAYCSSDVLSDEQGCTLDEFFARIAKGNTRTQDVLDTYIGHLARGIQSIHTMLGVDVALGGELASYLDPYFEKISTAVSAIDPFPTGETCVLRTKHPTHGVPIGAAQLMAARFIESV